MYERFFGFRERPFDLTPDPRYFVLTDAHREAMSTVEYAIASRKGITLLLGEAGCGKTTVIRAAIDRQPDPVHCVHLSNPALTRPEFVEMLAAQFDLSARARESKAVFLLELEALLRCRHEANEPTVLIVDEAQSLPFGLLEEIRLLANIETKHEKLLSVILAGQPALGASLEDPSASQLKQRIALWCELRSLTLQETSGYMLSRIQSAGGIASNAFTAAAVKLIHAVSRGLPRVINVLADNALLTGLAAATRPVTSRIVEEVCHDFRIGQPSPQASTANAPLSASSVQASSGHNDWPSVGEGTSVNSNAIKDGAQPEPPPLEHILAAARNELGNLRRDVS
jgi:general secretion pathway protein A